MKTVVDINNSVFLLKNSYRDVLCAIFLVMLYPLVEHHSMFPNCIFATQHVGKITCRLFSYSLDNTGLLLT